MNHTAMHRLLLLSLLGLFGRTIAFGADTAQPTTTCSEIKTPEPGDPYAGSLNKENKEHERICALLAQFRDTFPRKAHLSTIKSLRMLGLQSAAMLAYDYEKNLTYWDKAVVLHYQLEEKIHAGRLQRIDELRSALNTKLARAATERDECLKAADVSHDHYEGLSMTVEEDLRNAEDFDDKFMLQAKRATLRKSLEYGLQIEQGCTDAYNSKAMKAYLEAPPDDFESHPWMFSTAYAVGGAWVEIPASYLWDWFLKTSKEKVGDAVTGK